MARRPKEGFADRHHLPTKLLRESPARNQMAKSGKKRQRVCRNLPPLHPNDLPSFAVFCRLQHRRFSFFAFKGGIVGFVGRWPEPFRVSRAFGRHWPNQFASALYGPRGPCNRLPLKTTPRRLHHCGSDAGLSVLAGLGVWFCVLNCVESSH